MSQMKQGGPEGDERHSTLMNNAGAIRAICSAVEGTLGPKGLDTMLVGAGGEVIITNDGVTILEKMDVTHPAARLLIQVARAQQNEVGDGTTTATVLAGALVGEGVAQVTRGVPVAKVVSGMALGIREAIGAVKRKARTLAGMDDPMLRQIALVAGREHEDIARLVVSAAERLGAEKLRDPRFAFSETVVSDEKADNEVWPGLLLRKKPLNAQMHIGLSGKRVLVLYDAFEPESIGEEALATEAGFHRYLELNKQFTQLLHKLVALDVGLVLVDRGVHPEAEQFCADQGIIVIQRAAKTDLHKACEFTGAKPLKRIALQKSEDELIDYLGFVEDVYYDAKLERVRLAGGPREPAVTIVVGASTREIVGERARIARDAAASVQAAVRGGIVPGGGAVEIAVARELERYREGIRGMEGFGVDAVSQALRKPLSQIVVNAGYNPLEKVEEAKAAQHQGDTDTLGIDCDTGQVIDMLQAGIVDPAPVKIHALQAAGEVAAAVLRIHTVIKMRSAESDDAY